MSILKNSFVNMSADEEALIRKYFSGYEYNSSGYTFLANHAWRTGYNIYWETVDKYMFIGAINPMYKEPHAFFSMPLTADGTYDAASLRAAVLEVKERCEETGIEFEISLVPWHMKHFLDEAFPGEIQWESDPGDADYVYLKEKLITLGGRALHKKKNHLNYFKKTYNYSVKRLNNESYQEAFDFVQSLREDKEAEYGKINSLHLEEEAIREFLTMVESTEVYSTAIYVDDRIVALALGERLSNDTVVEHFEKASAEYRGAYQAICSEFCKALSEEIIYVNREEDMGLENLRKAKGALKPVRMEEKYCCRFSC